MEHSRYAVAALLLFVFALLVTVPTSINAQAHAKDTLILRNGKSPLGGVKFNHKLHAEMAGTKCETCHHTSKPEMPAKSANQVCSD